MAEAFEQQPLRVLFILPSLAGGGAERVILSLLRHLDRARFEPLLALVDGRRDDLAADLPTDVAPIDLRCRRLRHALPALVLLLRRLRPDVVLTTVGHLNLGLALLRPLLPRRTSSVARETVVQSEELRHRSAGGTWQNLYAYLYRRHDAIVCQSDDMQHDLVRNFGLPQELMIRIPNPVDVPRVRALAQPILRQPGHVLQLVAAGRLVPQKGFDLLIGAIAALGDDRVHLMVLGEGPLRETLAAQIRELGLHARVQLAGYQRNPFPWIAGADAFVLSSRYEGFPNVVLEALACGTPVLALPAPGGVREILDRMSGCVVADGMTQQALVDMLRRWLAQPPVRMPVDVVDSYRMETVLAQYQRLFERVAASRSAAVAC